MQILGVIKLHPTVGTLWLALSFTVPLILFLSFVLRIQNLMVTNMPKPTAFYACFMMLFLACCLRFLRRLGLVMFFFVSFL